MLVLRCVPLQRGVCVSDVNPKPQALHLNRGLGVLWGIEALVHGPCFCVLCGRIGSHEELRL